jgi:hypothetical protein
MADLALKILVFAFAAWVVWSILQIRYVFEIRIRDGQPSIRRGKVQKAFLGSVALVCQEGGVSRGWIGGVTRGKRVMLRFSRHFPPGTQQRLRNEWQASD